MKPQPTDAMIEAAAKKWFARLGGKKWQYLPRKSQDRYRKAAKAVLIAALTVAWRPLEEYPTIDDTLFMNARGKATHFIPRSVLGEPE